MLQRHKGVARPIRKMFAKAVVALCVGSGSIAFAKAKLFESGTESETRGWPHISESLAESLFIESGDYRSFAKQAIKDNQLRGNLRQFLVQKQIPVSVDKKERFFFIRPPLKPYYSVLYGAHAYTFWIVNQNQKTVFFSAGDQFSVLEAISDGMHDVEVMNAFGGLAYRAVFAFDGSEYKAKSCSTEIIQDRRRIDGCERIDYEEFERRLKAIGAGSSGK